MSVHIKPDGTWYTHWRDENGERHTKPFGRGDIAKAQAEEHNTKLKLDKKLGKSTIPAGKSIIRLDGLSQAYINNCRANGKNEKWIGILKNLLNKHWLPKLTHKSVDQLTRDDINKFINENYNHVKQITRNRYMDYLKIIFNYGIDQGLTHNNPLAKWRKGVEQPRKVLLTVADLAKIRACADRHLQMAIDIIWHTGIRPGPKELFSLKWEQIDFDRQIIRVLGKRNMWREVPVNSILKERLLEHKETSEAIAEEREREPSEYVIEYHGGGVSDNMKKSLKAACKAAGIEYPVCLYSIRHLYVTTAIGQGADVGGLSKNCGHTTPRMVMNQYLHISAGAQRQVADSMPDLAKKNDTGKVIPITRRVPPVSSKKSSNEKRAGSALPTP